MARWTMGWAVAGLLPLAAACSTGTVGMSTLGPHGQGDVAAHSWVSAVDAGEIQQAQLARSRASSPAVRDFASRMITEHSNALAMREEQMQRAGLGLRTSSQIAAGNIGWAPPTPELNGQGVISNSARDGGVGTTGTGMGAVSNGTNGGNREAAQNGQGVVSTSTAGGGNGTTGTGLGEVSTGSGSMGATDMTGAFTASMVLTPMGMQELNGLLMQNPYSRPTLEAGMADLQALQGMSGHEFDVGYMDRQVAAHQFALASLDRILAQGGMGRMITALLTQNRAAVAMHLQMAQQVRAGL
jgi:predicted outer membrane protein